MHGNDDCEHCTPLVCISITFIGLSGTVAFITFLVAIIASGGSSDYSKNMAIAGGVTSGVCVFFTALYCFDMYRKEKREEEEEEARNQSLGGMFPEESVPMLPGSSINVMFEGVIPPT